MVEEMLILKEKKKVKGQGEGRQDFVYREECWGLNFN